MKRLTLIRHAKSCWKNPDLNDFDRPLNKRGKRDLPKMVERVALLEQQPDYLLSSAANRTATTANSLSMRLGLTPEHVELVPELYESRCETLIYILQAQVNSAEHIMLVGHNPGLIELAEFLTQTKFHKFPTAAVAQMHLSITQWQELAAGCATLTHFDYPKKHIANS